MWILTRISVRSVDSSSCPVAAYEHVYCVWSHLLTCFPDYSFRFISRIQEQEKCVLNEPPLPCCVIGCVFTKIQNWLFFLLSVFAPYCNFSGQIKLYLKGLESNSLIENSLALSHWFNPWCLKKRIIFRDRFWNGFNCKLFYWLFSLPPAEGATV